MKEAVKTLIHYPVYYHTCYDEMKKRGFNVDGEQWASDVKKVVQKLNLNPTHELNVISVGCGSGTVDKPIIDTLLTKHSSIRFIAIDPAVDELNKFKQLVKDNKDEWKNVVFDFQTTTIEEYLEVNGAQTFGFIVMSHSAYHFKDVATTVVDLYNRLVKGGMLFSKMIDGGWEKFSAKVGEYFTDPKFNFIGTHDVEDVVKRRIPNARYETKKRDYTMDITECFDEESQAGALLIDFITILYKFRETCKPEIKKIILEYLVECCQKEGDKMLLSTDERDIVIFKD
ncbi:histamine N-methyltransferase-like [Saccoglossus kowalevskii]